MELKKTKEKKRKNEKRNSPYWPPLATTNQRAAQAASATLLSLVNYSLNLCPLQFPLPHVTLSLLFFASTLLSSLDLVSPLRHSLCFSTSLFPPFPSIWEVCVFLLVSSASPAQRLNFAGIGYNRVASVHHASRSSYLPARQSPHPLPARAQCLDSPLPIS